MKFAKDLTIAVVRIVWLVLLAFLYSCLEGMIFFLVTVVVSTFFAWLFGANDPRNVALTAGTIMGGLCVVGIFLYKLTFMWGKFNEELQKQRIKKIMESDD